jgi:hypothetical protein
MGRIYHIFRGKSIPTKGKNLPWKRGFLHWKKTGQKREKVYITIKNG